jgi:hypothetical protein
MSVEIITSTYDGQQLQEWPPGLFIEHRSETLEVRGSDSQPIGASGVFARPRRITRRIILYTGIISNDPTDPDPRASYRTQVTAFEALFDLTDHGILSETLEDGSVRTLDVRPRNRTLDRNLLPELADVSVEFESYESPDWEVTPP